MKKPATEQAKRLFQALCDRGIDCALEYYDGHKTIDIAINESKIDIEVDGLYHLTDPKQLVADIRRSRWSSRHDFNTIHVFNSVIEEHLNEVADAIAEVAKHNKGK